MVQKVRKAYFFRHSSFIIHHLLFIIHLPPGDKEKYRSVKKIHYLSFAVFIFISTNLYSQCISSFPYNEGFELSPGGWSSGGTNNDWTWGTPAKPVISSAGSGMKCWIAGGLTGSLYNDSVQSYVLSPCFNFTTLTYPHISFKIFWEVEKKFDGGNFQYSPDSGITWINVGFYGDTVDCMNNNWFNDSSIKYLNNPIWIPVKEGWSGNIQSTAGNCLGGSGSGGWVTAQHCMPYLAGVQNVIFRFTLGTGNTCSSYDGLAFDDVIIKNAPANVPEINYSCSGSSVAFTGSGTPCPKDFSWNFGDPSSGSLNTSNLQNPVHQFASPGIYTVTLTTGGPCNPPGTFSKTIMIPEVNIIAQTDVTCNGGNNGAATVTISSAASPYNLQWSNGQGSLTASGLQAGIYSVTLTDNAGCTSTDSVVITEPAQLISSGSFVPAGCGMSNGSATIIASGGTSPYSFVWNNNQTAPTATGLAAGLYFVTVTDSFSCDIAATITVSNANAPAVSVISTNPVCNNGSDGTVAVTATGGSTPYTYLWSNNAASQQTPTATGLPAGIYFITVTDANGCEAITIDTLYDPPPLSVNVTGDDSVCKAQPLTLTADFGNSFLWNTGDTTSSIVVYPVNNMTYFVTVTSPCGALSDSSQIFIYPEIIAYAGKDTTVPSGSMLVLNATGGALYSWSTGESSSAIEVSPAQNTIYTVTVTDAYGCSEIASVTITVREPEKYFVSVPTVFTPNSDGRNDWIYVHGNGITDLQFIIYDRWGEKIFESGEKNNGWDGTRKGKTLNAGVFAYYLEVTFKDGSTYSEKGNITLLK